MHDVEIGGQEIDAYVRRLLWALQSIDLEDRLAISGEIHSHLTDCAAQGRDRLAAAMARLGPPHLLARRYVEDYELAGAISRAVPAQLLANMVNRASRSLGALGATFSALLLYLLAAALAVIAVAKPIAPGHVGAWHGSAGWQAGLAASPPAGGLDILGYWIVPLAMALALFAYLAATQLLRLAGGRALLAHMGRRAGI